MHFRIALAQAPDAIWPLQVVVLGRPKQLATRMKERTDVARLMSSSIAYAAHPLRLRSPAPSTL